MNYSNVLLLKLGEISLKGLNRANFENMLIRNIKKIIPDCKVEREQSTITLYSNEDYTDKIKKIFGIAVICPAVITDKNMEAVIAAVKNNIAPHVKKYKTFKVEAKRSDKLFPLKSPEITSEVGHHMIQFIPDLKVDLYNPEITVTVEIRGNGAFIHYEKIKGAGGLPVGSGGRGLLLLSGGIDSPVAGYMMARRGVEINALHYSSEPYTSLRAKEKTKKLTELLSAYTGNINFINISLTKIQEEIQSKCNHDYSVVLLRRFMMRIAEKIAVDNDCKCVITGESLGQVASQTAEAIVCTDCIRLPVFRPLIGMDKIQIIDIAQNIGTYETSIEPYEDCCTVFTPRHPITKPKIHKVLEEESKLDTDKLIEEAIN